MDKNENVIQIGLLAQALDAEYSIFERMKIKKESLKRVGYAIGFYISVMIIFTIVL